MCRVGKHNITSYFFHRGVSIKIGLKPHIAKLKGIEYEELRAGCLLKYLGCNKHITTNLTIIFF